MRELVGISVQQHDGGSVRGAGFPVEDAVSEHGGVTVTYLDHD